MTDTTELDKLYSQYPKELIDSVIGDIVKSKGDLSHIFEVTHKPVDIITFITDKYYMGTLFESVWEGVIESVDEVISGGYVEAVFTGAIGAAKTTRATIITAYNLYCLSCYINPQEKIGLMPNSEIVIAMLNKNETLAREVTYKKFRGLIKRIPYFRENFMFSDRVESKMLFPKDITVIYASATNDKLLGMDVVSAIVDEINFFDRVEKSKRARDGGTYDQAIEIYNGLIRRIKSRFMGIQDITGCVSVVSSRSHKGDFTDRRMESLEEDKKMNGYTKTYVSNLSQWEIIPNKRKDGTVRFCGRTFKVAIGNNKHKSEVLVNTEETYGREVIEVPIEFEIDFVKDIEGSLRDFAGRVSSTTGKYFTNIDMIIKSFETFETQFQNNRIFLEEEWDFTDGLPTLNPNFTLRNRSAYRAVHIDLGLTNDRCGIAIGHSVTDTQIVLGRDRKGLIVDDAPLILYDDFIGINPPQFGEIQISDVRKLIIWLNKHVGIPIKWITMDGYQSKDFLQIMNNKGYITKTISVEGENSYMMLKNAINENRVIMPRHDLLYNELINLKQDEKTKRVDHDSLHSKDISDGMAGVHSMIMELYDKKQLYDNANLISGLYLGEFRAASVTSGTNSRRTLVGSNITNITRH